VVFLVPKLQTQKKAKLGRDIAEKQTSTRGLLLRSERYTYTHLTPIAAFQDGSSGFSRPSSFFVGPEAN
jgi:hypothetical protein